MYMANLKPITAWTAIRLNTRNLSILCWRIEMRCEKRVSKGRKKDKQKPTKQTEMDNQPETNHTADPGKDPRRENVKKRKRFTTCES